MDKISIILPSRNEVLLNKTIDNIQRNSIEDIEFIVVLDGIYNTPYQNPIGYKYGDNGVIQQDNVHVVQFRTPLGKRRAINYASQIATGKYLFHIDAHCSMSHGWDKRLKECMDKRDVLFCPIISISPDTLESINGSRLGSFSYIDPEYNVKWWVDYQADCDNNGVIENMAMPGCAWLIERDYYWDIGGHNESIGEWGLQGSEIALNVWLNPQYPGRILTVMDVRCGHVYRDRHPYTAKWKIEETRSYLKGRYKNDIYKLINKFSPVPEWTS